MKLILQYLVTHPDDPQVTVDRERIVTVDVPERAKNFALQGHDWVYVGVKQGLPIFRPDTNWKPIQEWP